MTGFAMIMGAIHSVPRVESKLYPVEVDMALVILVHLMTHVCIYCRVVRTKDTLM